MLNRCSFIGHLGRDPEIRSTQSGTKVATISVGVTRKWKDGNGEQKDQTEWVKGVIWGSSRGDGLAGVAERYLKKGSQVFIAGRMETRKWTDQSGAEKYTTEIIVSELELLGSRNGGADGGHQGDRGGQQPSGQRSGGGGSTWEPPADDFDDSIPFVTGLDATDALLRSQTGRGAF